MFLYLPAVSALITYYIFNSKGIDYRMVALGSLLPISIDLAIGHPSLGHSFLFPVAALILIMLITIGRSRMLRRQLLCIVIGIFLALVLEGSFLHEQMWWWPSQLRANEESLALFPSTLIWIVRDAIGLIALYVLFSIGELYKKEKRSEFFSTGRITSN